MMNNAPAYAIRGENDDRLSLDLFYSVSEGGTDGEIATPLTPRYSTYKKLEVINARRINALAGLYNLLSFSAVAISGIVIILTRTTFARFEPDVPVLIPNSDPEEFKLIDVHYFEFPRVFTIIDTCLNCAFFLYSVLLFVFFVTVLFKAGQDSLLNEQIWVTVLLAGAMLYLNPFESVLRLLAEFFNILIPGRDQGLSYVDIFVCLRMLAFSTISMLYVWMGSHSYRYLSRRISVQDWTFYVPKIATALIYNAYKLSVLFVFRIAFSELPFASLVAFLSLYGSVGVWPRLAVITVSVLTALEFLILVWILVDVLKTARALSSAEYVKHRTKILGFRFFLHQQGIFYAVYVANYALILFGLPKGPQVLQFSLFADNKELGRGSYFDVLYAPLGLQLCILAYITTEVYTNLPASFSFDLGWFKDESRREEAGPEPIVYRNREPPSITENQTYLSPYCFVMQTNVELFNLAWFVYYQGTPKESRINVDYDKLPLKITSSLFSKETDTRAFVAESADRIVIAFKGTTSRQNLLTDLKVLHRPLPQVIQPEVASFDDPLVESGVFRVLKSKSFRRAKVHAGFVDAYNSIREELVETTKSLLREKDRPIYLTGHSLGGALATLSSLDISLSLNVPSSRIMVSTFGSPRIGNDAFREVYDSRVPINWRLVAGGDIVSRLPKIGYVHVGKRVVLTASGDLFIDPSALEIIFWHSPPASFVHHRKSWYMLSLKSWCLSRLDNYRPRFWPFPVSESDNRRFESSLRKPNSRGLPSISRRGRGGDRVDKYKMFADFVDDIDGKGTDEVSVANWGRLTRRLIEIMRSEDTPIILLGRSSSITTK